MERVGTQSIVGNIYKGKVAKVLPGMQSAFIDIGLKKSAFIHIVDLNPKGDKDIEFPNYELHLSVKDNIDKTDIESSYRYPPIEDQITESQDLIIQVTKNFIGDKGARLTTNLSIPGRFLVLMPNSTNIGISRKIESEESRERLQEVLESIRPENYGLIARTVSEFVSKDQLEQDLDYLIRLWDRIESDISTAIAPTVLYEDLGLIFKVLRDIVSPDISRIIVDDKVIYDKMCKFISHCMPKCNVNIEHYDDHKVSLFDVHNIEGAINKILEKRVWLRSGGYIIIDYTEALTVIDVNTGKYVGKHDFNDTILKTNLEATKEIALQLKLRNIGGIIIIDFIDMEREEDKLKILSQLDQYLKEDRAKTAVIDITMLGLVEITRKRVQEPVSKMITETCPYCDGRGFIRSKITICYDIMRSIVRVAKKRTHNKIFIETHTDIADLLIANEKESIDIIEATFNIHIVIKSNQLLNYEQYKLIIS